MAVFTSSTNWRYHALNILTGEWLHRELPLRGVQITETLTGPGGIKASIDPDLATLKNSDGSPILDEWSTLIIAEADGAVRGHGILTNADLSGSSMSLDCVGFSAYPQRQILEDSLAWSGNASLLEGGHGVDPLSVVRILWASLQSKPDANLGIIVDDTVSPYRLGAFTNVQAPQKSATLPDGSTNPKEVGPNIDINRVWGPTDRLPTPALGKILTWIYALYWWDNVDIGAKIDELAKQTPFDYREDVSWADDTRDALSFRLRLGYPRLGTRRSDLRFAEGENVSQIIQIKLSGDDYSNHVYALGAGQGQAQIRTTASKRDGRLRRMIQLTDGSATTVGSLNAAATHQLNLSNKLTNIVGFSVRDHPNAPIGSFAVGDDVLVQTQVGWQPTTMWVRITSATINPETDEVDITCSRSDRFNYTSGGVS